MFKKAVMETKSFIEYWFIPITAAILPYRIALYYLKGVARVPFLYNEVASVALYNAKQLGLVSDERVWELRFKVNQIIDIVDVFLYLLRGRRYIEKNIICNFDVDKIRNADIIFFPHYGCGLLFHKMLVNKGINAILLANPMPLKWSGSNFFYLLLCRLRSFVLKNFSNTQMIPPHDLLPIRKALQNDKLIMLTPDVPSREGLKTYQVDINLGMLHLPAGFFDFAQDRKLKVVNMTFGFDYTSGKRYFESDEPYMGLSEEHAKRFAIMLDTKVKENSYLWLMLNVANKLLF